MVDNSKFVKSLENAVKHIISEREKNMKKVCLLVERDAKKECPVDEGTLRSSITHDVQQTMSSIVGTVYSNIDYAPFVEMGTGIFAKNGDGRKTPWNWGNPGSNKWRGRKGWKGSKPHPYLQPAIDNNRDRIPKILGGKE